MNFKKILLLTGFGVAGLTTLIINIIVKNTDDFPFSWHLFREVLVFASIVCFYVYFSIKKSEFSLNPIGILAKLSGIIGSVFGIFFLLKLLSLIKFTVDDTSLHPNDDITIILSTTFSIITISIICIILIFLQELIFIKQKTTTKRNFLIAISFISITAISTIVVTPLETPTLTAALFGISTLGIITNSFRLSWISYLSRKEKIYILLYALSSLAVFIGIFVVSEISETYQYILKYCSYPLFVFTQLITLFGLVYCGMISIATLFQLPNSEVLDRKRSEVTSLQNISQQITQVFDIKELTETVTSITFELCKAKSVWLETYEKEKNPQDCYTCKNISIEEIENLLGEKSELRELALSSKKIIVIDNIHTDHRTKHFQKNKTLGSLVIVPLLSHDTIIGTLYATKEMEFGFEQDDVNMLSGFANQISIAIENARLVQKAIEKERMQKELFVAREIQKKLLPQQLPKISTIDISAASSPALEVGGDYYDIIQIDEKHVGIIIGDVSGKGVSAAFYMAEMKGIFQSLSKIYLSPKEFLLKANETILPTIDKKQFISLLYAVLNIKTGKLIFARAGHNPLLYINTKETKYLTSKGLVVGVCGGKQFSDTIEEISLQLQKNDICVFYTDGITEATSEDYEEFGEEQLANLVYQKQNNSTQEIQNTILENIYLHTNKKNSHDDVTLIVLKWLGK